MEDGSSCIEGQAGELHAAIDRIVDHFWCVLVTKAHDASMRRSKMEADRRHAMGRWQVGAAFGRILKSLDCMHVGR